MRRAGAAASVSLTVAVAAATSVIVAGILVGPSILDCSKSDAGAGSCLRAKAEAAGWLPVARKSGQIDASAAEAVPSRSNSAALSPASGAVNGLAVSAEPSAADVAIADTRGSVAAQQGSEPLPGPGANADLSAPNGRLMTGAVEPTDTELPAVSLSEARGNLEATGDLPQATATVGASVAPFLSGISATGVVQPPAVPIVNASLSAPPGAVSGNGDVTVLAPLVANVAARGEGVAVSVGGSVGSGDEPDAVAAVAPPSGDLAVSAPTSDATSTVSAVLAAPSVSAVSPSSTPPPATIVAVETSAPEVQALAGGSVEGALLASASASLVAHPASDTPKAAAIEPPVATPPVTESSSTFDPPAPHPPAADPPKAAETPKLKSDPRYPNFVVLAMPRGDTSTVVTLKVK